MIQDIKFKEWAVENGFDVSYNFQSNYYNSRDTRIAYFAYEALSSPKGA